MEYVFFAHRFQLFQRGLFFSRLPRIQLVEYVGGNLIFADVLHNPIDHGRMNRYSNSRHTAHLLLFVSFMIAYLWSEFYRKEIMRYRCLWKCIFVSADKRKYVGCEQYRKIHFLWRKKAAQIEY